MTYPNNYCPVEADTARYYDELDAQDAKDEAIDEAMTEMVDDLLFYGKAKFYETSLFLSEIISEICKDDDEDLDNYSVLTVNLLTGKGKERDKEAADVDLQDFLKPKLESYIEQYRDEIGEGVDQKFEDDHNDYLEARAEARAEADYYDDY